MGILQARILEWLALPSSGASSQPRDRTQVFLIAGHQGRPLHCSFVPGVKYPTGKSDAQRDPPTEPPNGGQKTLGPSHGMSFLRRAERRWEQKAGGLRSVHRGPPQSPKNGRCLGALRPRHIPRLGPRGGLPRRPPPCSRLPGSEEDVEGRPGLTELNPGSLEPGPSPPPSPRPPGSASQCALLETHAALLSSAPTPTCLKN